MSLPKEERRNATKLYNKMTIAELQNISSAVPWLEYINTVLAPTIVVCFIISSFIKNNEDISEFYLVILLLFRLAILFKKMLVSKFPAILIGIL